MFTVIWTDNGKDRWERLETKEELAKLMKTLADEPGVCESDAWIFGHEADDHANDYYSLKEHDDELNSLIKSIPDVVLKIGMTGILANKDGIKPSLRGKKFTITDVTEDGRASGTIEGKEGLFVIDAWSVETGTLK